MFRNRILTKTLAVFFILEIALNIAAPTISYALTAGPTAPEATSFEPVDTTDMVNLSTGDFVYNIPMLEVPGPAGGYPLSLSYHAGIQPNEDASWVGLGWTLNPGAINRNVSGYADDLKNESGSVRTFWEGGSSQAYSFSVSVGSAGNPSMTAGLSYSEDTYAGVSQTSFVTVGIGSNSYTFSQTTSDAGTGVAATQNTSVSAKIGLATYSLNTSGGLGGLDYSFKYTDPKEMIPSFKSMDISLASAKSYAITKLTGVSIKNSSSKSGKVSSKGHDFSITVPIKGVNLNYSSSHKRYWIDETTSTWVNGSLYFPSTSNPGDFDHLAYDVYDLRSTTSLLNGRPPDESFYGSFIDYDNFNVLGQGISGTFRPYHYKSYLMRQNSKEDNGAYRMKTYPLGVNSKPVNFRFVGDFSNRFLDNHTSNEFVPSDGALGFTYSNTETTGETGDDGYDSERNILAGSKSIEWFTNQQMLAKPTWVGEELIQPPPNSAYARGMLDCTPLGFNRLNNDQIGGFKITNSDGVTYHYALPVYSFDEWSYSGTQDEKGKHSYNEYKNPYRYAYTWLLTAVSGPDYVDANKTGMADKGDFGYWVSFEYGKWSGNYSWRNPSIGFNKDVDQNFNNFSKGIKEIYYLNAIQTQSHTAVFVKEKRKDGKGVVHEFSETVKTTSTKEVTDIDQGGFQPKTKSKKVYQWDSENGVYVPYTVQITEDPVSTLRLAEVMLFENTQVENYGSILHHLASRVNSSYYDMQYDGNVITTADTVNLSKDLYAKSIKRIRLLHDYSLAPDCLNSFNVYPEYLGKLTLNSIETFNKGSIESLIPPTKFSYDSNKTFIGQLDNYNSRILVSNPEDFKVGEIFTINHSVYGIQYIYIRDIDINGGSLSISKVEGSTWRLGSGYNRNPPSQITTETIQFVSTKNPPYNKDKYDMWGFYKVDYFDTRGSERNENESRMTTSISKGALDVWSLRSIKTSMGATIEIDYDADQYQNAIKSLNNVPIQAFVPLSNNSAKVYLYENVSEYGLSEGDEVDMAFIQRYVQTKRPGYATNFECNGNEIPNIYKWHIRKPDPFQDFPIQSVVGKTFIINLNGIFSATGQQITYVSKKYVSAVKDYPVNDGQPNSDYIQYINEEPEFVGGELIFNNSRFSPYGGGIRVSKVTLKTFDGERSTHYNYFNGVTPYEPNGYSVPFRRLTNNPSSCIKEIEQRNIDEYREQVFKSNTFEKYLGLFTNSRELPGPGVLYGRVQVSEEVKKNGGVQRLGGINEYEFEVFSPEDINIQTAPPPPNTIAAKIRSAVPEPSKEVRYTGQTVSGLRLRDSYVSDEAKIEDFSALFGNLKKVTYYDLNGNKIKVTTNNYLHDNVDYSTYKNLLSDFNSQGVITETFADARLVYAGECTNPAGPCYTFQGLLSQRVMYPSIQVGQTEYDYKLNTKSETSNLAFDFYSGQVIESKIIDGYGNVYITKTTPAYRKYSEGMGLSFLGGKNMLIQEASSLVYKINPTTKQPIGLVSATAQTWSDTIPVIELNQYTGNLSNYPGIWRKHSTYTYVGNNVSMTGDGLYEIIGGQLPEFDDWQDAVNGTNAAPAGWQRNSEITLYDVSSHALEARDLNNLFAATKLTLDHSKVIATVANAEFQEFAYSGGEEKRPPGNYTMLMGGGVFVNGSLVPTAHTGKKGVSAIVGSRAFTYNLTPKIGTYLVSVWSSQPDAEIKYKLDNLTPQAAIVRKIGTSGAWHLLQAEIPIANNYDVAEVWCEAKGVTTIFDDFRIHPIDAAMTSYVYNEWGELSHILDNNNLYTEYRYDGMGRLKETYRESFQYGVVKSASINYHYALQQN